MMVEDNTGYGRVRGLFQSREIEVLLANLPALEGQAGTRNLLGHSWCQELADDPRLTDLASQILRANPRPVRAILFDKVAGKNWTLGWHQDTKIAVNTHRPDLEGFTGWSEKEGIIHTLPPREVLEAGLALRLHLDPCPAENGPLQVIPNSHLNGVREAPTDDEIATAETLVAEAGDVIWMRPLVFHGSPKAERIGHRRVLHLEYSAAKLPEGLDWAWPLEMGLS